MKRPTFDTTLTPSLLQELARASQHGAGRPMVPPMRLALEASFGSVERWHADALSSTDGWRLLVFAPEQGRLVQLTLTEPLPSQVGGVPVLAIDARSAAFGVGVLTTAIDWDLVYTRYQAAVHDTSQGLGMASGAVGQRMLIDVRRAGAYEEAGSCLPGATWRDPVAVGRWADELPRDRDLVVYCVHGHDVSQATAMRLRAAGFKAHYLDGGIDGWLAAGGAMVPKAKD